MSVTLTLVEPSTTWLLVSTSPDESSTIPVPAASPPSNPRRVVMSTSPGSTLAATVLASDEPCDGTKPKGEPDPVWFRIELRPTAMPSTATRHTAAATASTRSGLLRGGGRGGSQMGGPPHWPGVQRPPPSHGCDGPCVAHPGRPGRPGGPGRPDPPGPWPAAGWPQAPGGPASGGLELAGYGGAAGAPGASGAGGNP